MKDVIKKFYQAFNDLDAETMSKSYHPNATFHDPAFGTLRGNHIGNMWKMLCTAQKNKSFKVTIGEISQIGDEYTVTWQAWYTYTPTGRNVHNVIKARIKFEKGQMIDHVDDFNIYKWSVQAMGWKGLLIGWTNFFKSKFRSTALKSLHKFEAQNGII